MDYTPGAMILCTVIGMIFGYAMTRDWPAPTRAKIGVRPATPTTRPGGPAPFPPGNVARAAKI